MSDHKSAHHSQSEGVIKFILDFKQSGPVDASLIQDITPWRKKLYELRLIGQNPDLYEGYSYGNMSRRIRSGNNVFIITGSQTSHLPELNIEHYSQVISCDIDKNLLVAKGPLEPSSEALSHYAIYFADQKINFVFHVHSALIWENTMALSIPMTSPDIQYGTPAMAQEIISLLQSKPLNTSNILAMGGHQDGIISFGETAEQAGQTILDALYKVK